MFTKSKIILMVLSLSLVALGLMAFSPFDPTASPMPSGQGNPNGQGGYGRGSGMGYGRNGQASGMGAGMGIGACGQNCTYSTQGTGTALTPLSDSEETALKEAIYEEYGALNLYQAVIAKLGNIYPFSQIVRAEQQHVTALLRQAEKYDVDAPANPGLASPVSYTTLAEACQAGVDAETADAALYDELKPVTTHSDLLTVYNRLQMASLNSHLPAFEACN
jgi:hypothetical protein